MTMRHVYQITSVLIFIPSLWLVREALNLHYYTSMGPGPGFFPFWLALILGGLAILMFANATFGAAARTLAQTRADDLFPDRPGLLRLAIILMALGANAFLLERIGFGLTMFIMNVVVLRTLGIRSVFTILWVSIIGSFGIEYAFTHWLNVPLPATDFSLICPTQLCGE